MRNPFRRSDTRLPPCPEGFEDLWVTLHVRLHQQLKFADEPEEPPAQGYYQVLGLRIQPETVRETLASIVTDGEIGWIRTEWHSVDPSSLKPDIRKQITLPQSTGTWFRSGRIFYAETNEVGSVEAEEDTSSSVRPN